MRMRSSPGIADKRNNNLIRDQLQARSPLVNRAIFPTNRRHISADCIRWLWFAEGITGLVVIRARRNRLRRQNRMKGSINSIGRGKAALPGIDAPERGPLLLWMIFTGLCIFAVVLLWRYGLIRLMLTSDRTYISSVIAALYIITSCHCFW